MKTRRHVFSVIAVVAVTALCLLSLLVFNVRPKLGLDLQGGVSVVLTARGDVDEEVLDQTVEIIRNRVDSLGAQEPDIAREGVENIIVQLPGIEDQERALEIIGQTAQLRFREVIEAVPIEEAQSKAAEEGLRPGSRAYDAFIAKEMETQDIELSTDDPTNEEVVFAATDEPLWYRLGPAKVVGSDIAHAQANFDTTTGSGWHVLLEMTNEGQGKWSEVTTELAGKQAQLAIVLDQRVESAPVVNTPITDGKAQITGQFSEQEAKDLGLVLRTGALPIELEQSQVQRVSATLGTASLRAGLIAGAVGLGLVAIYMFAFYRWLGVINLVGLAIFNTMLLATIGAISTYRGFSLTLAGIAGMIVSLGVAADTYIIYFERLKEEVREGKTFRSATDRAYRSAMRTNIAANTVAGGAALILYLLAVGPVRGFALTLGISVIFDLLLLYFFTHPVVALMARRGTMTTARAMGGGVEVREVVSTP
jgi:protein-export membrane protein SecD